MIADAGEDDGDEHACKKCNKSDHPEWLLLCDKCDAGWHCSCLRPALLSVPEGEWFCPPCEHVRTHEAILLNGSSKIGFQVHFLHSFKKLFLLKRVNLEG